MTTFPTFPPTRNKENEIMFYRKTRGFCSLSNLVQRSNINTPEPTLDLYEETVVLVTQSCSTLFDPMDCSPLGSPVHGISQARILEWDVIPFSRGSSQTQVYPHCRQILYLLSHQGRPAPMCYDFISA